MGLLSKLFSTRAKVMPVSVDDSNFDEVVMRSDVPVVVDFWSATCAPCVQLEPIMIDLATTYSGRVKVVEINVARARKISRRFGVMSTPTVLYFKGGAVAERVSGFRGSRYHSEIIDSDLLDGQAAAEASA